MASKKTFAIRLGAGAFAAGLSLLGPQALGVAVADSVDSNLPAPADSGQSPRKAPATRGRDEAETAVRTARAPHPSDVVRAAAAVSPSAEASSAEASSTRRRSGVRPATAAARGRTNQAATPRDVVVEQWVASAVVPAAAEAVDTPPGGGATTPPATSAVTPVVTVAPAAAVAPDLDAVNAEVGRFFNRTWNWLAGLPGNDLVAWAEGALLMVRRSFFNQAPRISPIQGTSSTGLVAGSLGAVDPEGDALEYSVVGGPGLGTVELGSDGTYTYTPGAGYAGSDAFIVKVAPAQPVFNLLSPFGDGSREVTIQVGAQASVNPYTTQDTIDTAVYLPRASAHVTIGQGVFGQFVGTVSLTDITPQTELSWMDAKGRTGQVSVADLASTYWTQFATAARDAGGGVTIALEFQSATGTTMSVLLADVRASQNPAGQYEFTGALAPDPVAGKQIDQWDVLGASFKTSYEGFRDTYLLGGGFETVSLDVAGADFFATTYSPSTYANALIGTDPGQTLSQVTGAAQTAKAAAGNAAAQYDARLTSNISAYITDFPESAVTVMLPYSGDAGNALVVGDGVGRVKLKGLTPGWTSLQGPGWQGSVNTIIPYGDGFVVGLQTGAIEQWSPAPDGQGGGFTELHDTGWESAAASMIPYQAGFVVGLANGSIQQWTGTGWAELQPQGWGGAANTLTAYQDGFVVGVGDGSVQQWTGTGWRELHNDGWRSPVTSTMTYGNGFIVGLGNGSIQAWTGSQFTELKGTGWGGAANTLTPSANTLTPWRSGFLVGLGTGSVQFYTGGGTYTERWSELKDSGWASPVISTMVDSQDRVVVGLQNGSIQRYSGSSWTELHAPWHGAATTLVPQGDGFAVGLGDGTVALWSDSSGWTELPPNRVSLTEDSLRSAIAYVEGGGEARGAGDPLFGRNEFLPGCAESRNCDGTFYPLLISKPDPYSLAGASIPLGTTAGQTLDLSYDLGVVAYGYMYVPGGTLNKFRPSQYAAGALLALPTGPSLSLGLAGENGNFTWEKTLVSGTAFYTVTPAGTVEVTAGVDAKLAVGLGLPDGFDKDALTAHAYYVPGMVLTINTGGNSGVQTGFTAYPDVDFSDFTSLTGVTITPTLTPRVEGSWGLFTPSNTPIIGKFSFGGITLDYQNPVALQFAVTKGANPSLTLSSSGILGYGAGILPSITSALTFRDEFEIYSVTTDNLLA